MADNGGVGTYGAMLAHFRARASISQERLARKAGVSNSLVSLIETGRRGLKRPDRNTVLRLGTALDLTSEEMDELLMSAGHYPTEQKMTRRRPSFASFVSTEPTLDNKGKTAMLALYDALTDRASDDNSTSRRSAARKSS